MTEEEARLDCISPIDGRVYVSRPLTSARCLEGLVADARAAQRRWGALEVAQRAERLSACIAHFCEARDALAREITEQMGRPIRFSPGEIGGFEERARSMVGIAETSLADIPIGDDDVARRFIRRAPLGVVLVVAPWNYPYLTAVNAVVPALLAGNAVILKHSSQTPLCGERFADLFAEAGLPQGLLQSLHASHETTLELIRHPGIGFVSFTGSVPGGHGVQRAASERFIATGLELGGKDPGYVRADADVAAAAEGLGDGAFFNSGQSCCGIERIYVARERFDDFVEALVDFARAQVLGDPRQPATTLGPMVRPSAAHFVAGQIEEAVQAGARALIDPGTFEVHAPERGYLAPQVLVDVDHGMRVMSEESFGPVVGVMPVDSDEEAIRLMNDSTFGLTAAVYTADLDRAAEIGDALETGTVFANRCDYLDPALAWTGVKDSGRGCSLSRLGFEALTRPKSFHLRRRA